MPGLRLTSAQVQRLCGVDATLYQDVCDALVDLKVLRANSEAPTYDSPAARLKGGGRARPFAGAMSARAASLWASRCVTRLAAVSTEIRARRTSARLPDAAPLSILARTCPARTKSPSLTRISLTRARCFHRPSPPGRFSSRSRAISISTPFGPAVAAGDPVGRAASAGKREGMRKRIRVRLIDRVLWRRDPIRRNWPRNWPSVGPIRSTLLQPENQLRTRAEANRPQGLQPLPAARQSAAGLPWPKA